MLSGAYIAILMMFLILFMNKREENRLLNHIIQKKRKGNGNVMLALAKRLIEKDVVIYTYNTQLTGVIKEVTEGALLIEKRGVTAAVNLNFVVKIKEIVKCKK